MSKAFGLVTFPLLARHFSVTDFGVLDYFFALASLLTIVLIFGQDSAVARFFYEHPELPRRRQLISQSLGLQLAGAACLVPALWLAAEWLSSVLLPAGVGGQTPALMRLVVMQLPFLVLINFSQNLLKWTFSRVPFLAMSLGMTVCQASGILAAVWIWKAGVWGVLLVYVATSMVFGMLGLFLVRQWLEWPRSMSLLRETLPYAMPLGLICVASAGAPTLERTLTDYLVGSTGMGLYASGAKVASLMGLVTAAFQTAWGPFSLSIHRLPDASRTYNQVLRLFALGACLVVLSLSLIGDQLLQALATDRYRGASVVIFPVAMGLAVQATSWVTELGITLSKQSHLHLLPYLLSLVVTMAGIWWLAPGLGLQGVGLGVLLGHVSKAVLASWLAQRVHPLPWSYLPVVVLMVVTLAVGIGASLLGEGRDTPLRVGLLVSGLVGVAVLGWQRLFTSDERLAFHAFVRARVAGLSGRAHKGLR